MLSNTTGLVDTYPFLIEFDKDITTTTFASLRKLGMKQGYITYDDVVRKFPEVEQNFEGLEQIYTALKAVGISFVDDDFSYEESSDDVLNNEENNSRSYSKYDPHVMDIEPDNLVGLYFNDVSRRPLLTTDEEVYLAKQIERGRLARREISDTQLKHTKRFKELTIMVEDGWIAVDHLIVANSRLVISIAKKYTRRGVPFLDLIQEGNIGLMRAVKRFDYKRGFKFSTYATWWIRQAVTRALANQSRTIRLPVHKADELYKLFRMQHILIQKLGRDPTETEMAKAMGVAVEKLRQILIDSQIPLSLEMPVTFEGDSVLGDSIEDHKSPDPDEEATYNLLCQHLDQILETLPAREVQILKLRFGLNSGGRHTLEQVGQKLGLTRERIRQLEAQAIRRLRHPDIRNAINSYLNP